MTIFLIIIAVLASIAIILWLLVIFSNEVENNKANDAFTPVWMTFLFFSAPWFVLSLILKYFNLMEIPIWTVVPLTIFGLAFATFSGYKALKNFLHQKEEFLTAQKLKIDSEYKKRFELIPNLVKVIKSYTTNENQILEKVLENREKTMQKLSEQNRKDLDQSVNILMNSAYDYPALQNMPLYRNLTASLINTQENITYFTSEYNKKASEFNSDLKSFPASIFYKKMNFKLAEYLDENVTDEQKKSETLLKDL